MTDPALNDTHRAILRALHLEPLAIHELARALGRTSEGIRGALPLLVARRLITRMPQPIQLGRGRPSFVYRRTTSWERAA